jgi:hypothetical protein
MDHRRSDRFAAVIARFYVGLGLVALGAIAGCVDVNGGAVEVAWAVFARDGRAINDCSCAALSSDVSSSEPRVGIAYVRLNVVSDPTPDSQPCAGKDSCRFACNRKVGATPFMIPPGRYLMSLVPVGADGNDIAATEVKAPPPISRFVVTGQPTELEAFMLEAANCASACNVGGITNACAGG